MKKFLAVIAAISIITSVIFAASSGGTNIGLILAAVIGVSATVACSAIGIIEAIERLPQPPK